MTNSKFCGFCGAELEKKPDFNYSRYFISCPNRFKSDGYTSDYVLHTFEAGEKFDPVKFDNFDRQTGERLVKT